MSDPLARPASKPQKPPAPRTCCPTHADKCLFGRDHLWSVTYLLDEGRLVNGQMWNEEGSMKCVSCNQICEAELREIQAKADSADSAD